MQFDIDITAQHKELFLHLREKLLNMGLDETKKERITTYSYSGGGICHMRTMPYGVDIGFLKGAQFEDDFEVLTGKAKKMRVLPLKEYNEDLVNYYLDQAIELVK